MNQLERQFAQRLDEIEKDLLTRYQQYLDRVIYLPHAYDAKQVALLQLPLQGALAKLLTDHAHEVFAIGQAHGDLLCREVHKKYNPFKLANWQPSFQLATFGYNVENFWLNPEAALKSLEARSVLLAGDVEADILSGVKKALLGQLHGATRSDTEAALAKLLHDNIDRAKLIITTETTYDYNRGRLSSFHANGVDYVQFSAVMDTRTSAQCRSRHGKVMRIDSPDLVNNIPPLHGRCRSVLTPLFSQYQSHLITPDSTNWENVAPLPKTWRMDSNNVVGKPLNEKPTIQSTAEKEIDRLLRNAPLYDRRKLANHLLRESGVNCPVHLIKLNENGNFRWLGKSGNIIEPVEVNLKSVDLRPERYGIKTVFHEITHARMTGARLEYSRLGFERWVAVEETVAETVAHYMAKQAGFTQEIVPSYSKYLVQNLPRLKQLPEFASCNSIADFGKVLAQHRYEYRTADWEELAKNIANHQVDMIKYAKQYEKYIKYHVDEIVQGLGDLSGITSITDEQHKYISDLIIKAWDNMDIDAPAFTDSLIIAMNRLGVN